MTSAHAQYTRMYTYLPPYPAYMYMSLCYITIQSQPYVILTCTFIHSHAPLKSLLYNAIAATCLAHTPLGWGSMYRPTCVMPISLADMHTYGRRSLHMCSFNSLGSMSHRLRRILCRVDDMESSSCMLSRNPSSKWHPQRISHKE